MKVDLDLLPVKKDLLVGLYNPVVSNAAGVSEVIFDVSENGSNVVHQDFTSAASAQAYFTDHPLDLGALGGIGSSLDLVVSMQVRTTVAGASFAAGLLIGDPPPLASSGPADLIAHMASFGGAPAGGGDPAVTDPTTGATPVLLAHPT